MDLRWLSLGFWFYFGLLICGGYFCMVLRVVLGWFGVVCIVAAFVGVCWFGYCVCLVVLIVVDWFVCFGGGSGD